MVDVLFTDACDWSVLFTDCDCVAVTVSSCSLYTCKVHVCSGSVCVEATEVAETVNFGALTVCTNSSLGVGHN